MMPGKLAEDMVEEKLRQSLKAFVKVVTTHKIFSTCGRKSLDGGYQN